MEAPPDQMRASGIVEAMAFRMFLCRQNRLVRDNLVAHECRDVGLGPRIHTADRCTIRGYLQIIGSKVKSEAVHMKCVLKSGLLRDSDVVC
jgi:hypothetical protein